MVFGKRKLGRKRVGFGGKAVIGAVLAVGVALLTSGVALAAECVGPDGKVTTTFFDWGCNNNGIIGMIITIFNWLSIGVALAVVGGIIYGGITYSTSSGDTGRTQEAITRIRNAVIALLMYFGMWAALNWLVPGGLFH